MELPVDAPASVTIRSAVREDLPAILALMAMLNPDDPSPDSEAARRTWEEILSDARTNYLVAEADGVVVGCCCLAIIPNLTRGLRPFGVIENVIVDVSWRNRGIATSLLRNAGHLAREAVCYKLMLMSNRKRVEAHPLYRKCGFESDSKLAFDMRLEK